MGENQYCTWDDAEMTKLTRKQERAKRALSDRQTVAINKLQEKINQLSRDQRKAMDDLRVKHMEEQDAICAMKPAAPKVPRCSCGGDCQRCLGKCKCGNCSHGTS